MKCLKGGKNLFLGSLEQDLPRRCVTHDNYVHKHAWPGGRAKKLSLRRLVEVDQSIVFFIQESMGRNESLIS